MRLAPIKMVENLIFMMKKKEIKSNIHIYLLNLWKNYLIITYLMEISRIKIIINDVDLNFLIFSIGILY